RTCYGNRRAHGPIPKEHQRESLLRQSTNRRRSCHVLQLAAEGRCNLTPQRKATRARALGFAKISWRARLAANVRCHVSACKAHPHLLSIAFGCARFLFHLGSHDGGRVLCGRDVARRLGILVGVPLWRRNREQAGSPMTPNHRSLSDTEPHSIKWAPRP